MLAAKKGLAALAGDEVTRADAETPDKPANAAASTGLRRNERKSEESFKSDGDSMEMRAIAKLELSAAALHEIADGFERTASSNQAMAGSRESLHVALGTRLMEKADKKGGQAFFRELDVNGDGSVTRIEFKQMMRKLGLLGEGSSFDVKAVDDLFSELDADGGGELDLGEILAALKKLKAKVLAVEQQEAAAQAAAENWRARAEQTRRAAERVAEKEVIASELHELRFNPSVEVRLVTLLSKAQLKPAEVLTKFDGNTDGKIDKGEFAKGFLALRIDATVEELHELHGKLDTDHSGALSLEEVKTMIGGIHAVKERAKEQERKLAKDLLKAEEEAKSLQSKIRAELMDDQRRKEEAEAEAMRAAEAAAKEQEAAAQQAKAKAEAKERWKRLQKEQFEKRIQEKRAANMAAKG